MSQPYAMNARVIWGENSTCCGARIAVILFSPLTHTLSLPALQFFQVFSVLKLLLKPVLNVNAPFVEMTMASALSTGHAGRAAPALWTCSS